MLDSHATARQRLLSPFRVLRFDEQVDIVLGLRPAAGPAGEAAAEHERNARVVECSGCLLHRIQQTVEFPVLVGRHGRRFPVHRLRGTWS